MARLRTSRPVSLWRGGVSSSTRLERLADLAELGLAAGGEHLGHPLAARDERSRVDERQVVAARAGPSFVSP